jgi:hypothetical protein
VWEDDDDQDHLVVVGDPIETRMGLTAVRLKRVILEESGKTLAEDAGRVDANSDYIVVVGEPVPADAVILPNGVTGVAPDEVAVRVRRSAAPSTAQVA